MGIRLPPVRLIAKLTTIASLFIITAAIILTAVCNYVVIEHTRSALYSTVESLPHNRVGVLLGTSKYSRHGGRNDHYRIRLDAAETLFKAGKIDYILISGDNGSRYYDEPTTIRGDLLKRGIPAHRIYRDYAGFRTLDSILRAHRVFQLDQFTIISQASHNRRAVYIALSDNIHAIAFNAGEGQNTDWINRGREVLARVLAVIETNVLHTDPRFLGPQVDIGLTPPT